MQTVIKRKGAERFGSAAYSECCGSFFNHDHFRDGSVLSSRCASKPLPTKCVCARVLCIPYIFDERSFRAFSHLRVRTCFCRAGNSNNLARTKSHVRVAASRPLPADWKWFQLSVSICGSYSSWKLLG